MIIYERCSILEVYDGLEICSGKALLSRCLRFGANLKIGSVDLEDWGGDPIKNPLDMCSTAGFAFLDCTIFLIHI